MMPGDSAALEFDDVAHAYGKFGSVRGVNFAVAEGEIVCLLGPSGCGKTTLLRLASGLEQPKQGTVRIHGETVADARRSLPPEKRSIGMVFQDYALFPHLSVMENVLFGLRYLDAEARNRRAKQTLERMGMATLVDRYPHMLSGGQQQRIALARALATRPRVMLMDEPFSGLDATLRHRVREETRSLLKEEKTTSLIVTHDPDEAAQLADRIILLRGGKVEQIGTPDALFFHPATAFAASFFGHASQFSASWQAGQLVTAFGSWATQGTFAAGDPLVAVVKHHAFQFSPLSPDAADANGNVLSFPAVIEESRWLQGQRLTRFRPLTGRGDKPGPLLHSLGSGLQLHGAGERVQCHVDLRMVFVYSST